LTDVLYWFDTQLRNLELSLSVEVARLHKCVNSLTHVDGNDKGDRLQ